MSKARGTKVRSRARIALAAAVTAFTLIGSTTMASALDVTSNSDTVAPVFDAGVYGPTAIDTTSGSAQVTVTGHITDDLSGEGVGVVEFTSPTGQHSNGGFFNLNTGTNLDGNYTAHVNFAQFSEPGDWYVSSVCVTDNVQNRRCYGAADMAGIGLSATLHVTSTEDTVAPTFSGGVYSPEAIDTTHDSAQVTVTGHIADDVSGEGVGVVEFTSPSGNQSNGGFFNLNTGTNLDGNFTAHVSFPQYSEPGDWYVSSLCLTDNSQNRRCYSGDDLAAVGMSDVLYITSAQDTVAPSFDGGTYSPNSIDTSTLSAQVTVTGHITDDLSGEGVGVVEFTSPSGNQSNGGFFNLNTGTNLDGNFTAHVSFPQYSEQGDWYVSSVCVTDNVQNRRCYSGNDLASIGLADKLHVTSDTTPPVSTATSICGTGSAVACSGTSTNVALSATDDASGVASIHAQIDGGEQQNFTGSSGTLSVPLDDQSGTRAIAYWATDKAGNVEAKNTLVVNYDNTAPEIDSITLSRTSFDVTVPNNGAPNFLLIRAHASDPSNDILGVYGDLTSPSGVNRHFTLYPDSGMNNYPRDDTFNGGTGWRQYTEAGDWTFTDLCGFDRLGNTRCYKTADLQAMGVPTIIHIDSVTDITPPALQSLTFTPHSINTVTGSNVMNITAHITDNISGVANLGITFYNSDYSSTDNTDLEITGGTSTDAIETGTLPWRSTDKSGSYTIYNLCVSDLAGNTTCYTNDQLKAMGITTTVGVITGPNADAKITGQVINDDGTPRPAYIDADFSPDGGWYHGPVRIRWTCQNILDSSTCPADTVLTSDMDKQDVSSGPTKDLNGDTVYGTLNVGVDSVAPVASFSATCGISSPCTGDTAKFTLGGNDDRSRMVYVEYDLDGVHTSSIPDTFTLTFAGDSTSESLTYWVEDFANNQTEHKTVVFHRTLDSTPPSVTGSVAPVPNSAGWNKGPVTVTWTATDDSGSATTPDPTTVSTEGANQTITSAQSCDPSGNCATGTVKVSIDSTKPTSTATSACGTGTDAFCAGTSANIKLTATDDNSGVDSIHAQIDGSTQQDFSGASATLAVPLGNSSGTHVITYWSTDVAGNVEAVNTLNLNYDNVAPTVSYTADPPPNSAGWNNTPVKITWKGQDDIQSATTPDAQTISTEGANQTVTSASSCDPSGNCSTGTTKVSIDLTKPIITGTIVGTLGSNGYYTSAVKVHWTCSDVLSGVATCPADSYLPNDGTNLSASGTTTDVAGNTATATVSGINIDATAPVSTATTTCGISTTCAGSTVNVNLAATDGGSGVASIHVTVDGGAETVYTATSGTLAVNLGSSSGTKTITFWAVDAAGNVEKANTSVVKYDNVAPKITHSLSPNANAAGWNKSDTTIHWTATDEQGGSGLASVTPDFLVNADTSGLTKVGTAVDTAGNTSTDPVTVKRDTVPPTITGVASGTKNGSGVYVGSVTVHFTCADDRSGVVSCPSDTVMTQPGTNLVVHGTATDAAGNTATYDVSGISIAPPVANVTVTTAPNSKIKSGDKLTGTIKTTAGITSVVAIYDHNGNGGGTIPPVTAVVTKGATAPDGTITYTFAADPPSGSNGRMTVVFRITDSYGQVTTTAPVSIVVS